MVRIPTLMPTLMVDGYELRMHNRPSTIYKVWKGNEFISKIHIQFKIVEAYTGTEVHYVPYDIVISILEGTDDLPMDLFKKIIMATFTMS